jgi:hypothetical protein
MKNAFIQFIAKVTAAATIVSMFATVVPVRAATLTTMKDTMTRVKISSDADHTIEFVSPTGVESSTDTIIVEFDVPGTTFDLTGIVFGDIDLEEGSSGTCSTATFTDRTLAAAAAAGTWGVAVNTTTDTITLTAPTDAPTGGITAGRCVRIKVGTNADTPSAGTNQINNPSTAGSYTIGFSGTFGDTGTIAVGIVDDDQVTVTASVDPSLTFNVGAQAPAAATCTTAFSGNGGTVALGTLSTASVTSSDVGGVNHICTRASTNATNGLTVTVKSLNGNLKSTSVPADTIPSASGAMAAGTANYGLCASDTVTGLTVTTPAGAAPARQAPFNGSCAADTAAGTVGALTTSAQTVWSTADAVANGFYTLVIKAAISGTIPAHNDYTDTLTFVATGTF